MRALPTTVFTERNRKFYEFTASITAYYPGPCDNLLSGIGLRLFGSQKGVILVPVVSDFRRFGGNYAISINLSPTLRGSALSRIGERNTLGVWEGELPMGYTDGRTSAI